MIKMRILSLGLIIFQSMGALALQPIRHAGATSNPSRFDTEKGGGASKLKTDRMDITNPGKHQMLRGGGR